MSSSCCRKLVVKSLAIPRESRYHVRIYTFRSEHVLFPGSQNVHLCFIHVSRATNEFLYFSWTVISKNAFRRDNYFLNLTSQFGFKKKKNISKRDANLACLALKYCWRKPRVILSRMKRIVTRVNFFRKDDRVAQVAKVIPYCILCRYIP